MKRECKNKMNSNCSACVIRFDSMNFPLEYYWFNQFSVLIGQSVLHIFLEASTKKPLR